MLRLFYRRFYILLFLAWLGATAGLFVLSVWGDFSTFVSDFDAIIKVEREQDPNVAASEDALTKATESVVHKAQVAKEVVRKEVVRDVQVVEQAVEKVERAVLPTTRKAAPQKSMKDVKKQADAMLGKARSHDGAGVVRAISFSESADRLIAHLKTTREVGKVTVFWLESPTRLVVDLRGDWKNTATRINRFKESFMHRVILGMHPDRLRVVFKFNDPTVPMGKRPGLIRTADGIDIVVEDPAGKPSP